METVAFCGFAGAGKDTVADRLVSHHGFSKLSFAAPLKNAAAKIFGLSDAQMNTLDLKEKPLDGRHKFPFVDLPHLEHLVVEATMEIYNLTPQECDDLMVSRQRLNRYPYEPPKNILDNILLRFYQVVFPELFGWVMGPTTPENTSTLSITPLSITPRRILQLMGTEVYRHVLPDTWTQAWLIQANRFDKVVATDCRFPNEVDAVHGVGGKVVRVDSTHPWVKRDTSHVSERAFQSFAVDGVILNNADVANINNIVDVMFGEPKDHQRNQQPTEGAA